MTRHRPPLAALTAAYLALVGWITLGPQPLDGDGQALVARIVDALAGIPLLAWLKVPTVEFAANIALFAPIGLLFALLLGRRRWWLAVLVGLVLTCTIEFAQQFLPTRVPDPRDLLANGLGAALGAGLGRLAAGRPGGTAPLRARRRPPPR
ncbi:VanZ family protein [Arenivirga flava]|uniref:VanZ-like domain-containing protein n=1 Tax=Arenivirga flava TaxID=1930060 RepID=A0AA37UMS0_9MICO|nr:VanZ family protein [Arenivirga flava]GMA27726.1 hypothetical protein GCM10025874_09790 [Arenivirga flava]